MGVVFQAPVERAVAVPVGPVDVETQLDEVVERGHVVGGRGVGERGQTAGGLAETRAPERATRGECGRVNRVIMKIKPDSPSEGG